MIPSVAASERGVAQTVYFSEYAGLWGSTGAAGAGEGLDGARGGVDELQTVVVGVRHEHPLLLL